MKAKTKRVVTALLAVVMLLTTLLPLTASAADVTMDLNHCHVSWDYTLTDEDGNEIELEHLDTVEYNGQTYMAFLPAEMSLEDAYELFILKVELEEEQLLLQVLQKK